MEQNYRGLPALVRHFGKDSGVLINFQPFVGKAGDPHWVQDLDSLRSVIHELIVLQSQGFPVIANADVLNGFMDYGPMRISIEMRLGGDCFVRGARVVATKLLCQLMHGSPQCHQPRCTARSRCVLM